MNLDNNPVCTFKITGEFGEFAKIHTATEILCTFLLYEVDDASNDVCLVAYDEMLSYVPLVVFRNYNGDVKELQHRCVAKIQKGWSREFGATQLHEEF